ncbi:hypothetical protein [Acetobacter pasteurianus]|uniref:hypothetical protein n=1 Tax=Acetobacter pasteurianus TaxID=438 RepID=UPI003D0AAA81
MIWASVKRSLFIRISSILTLRKFSFKSHSFYGGITEASNERRLAFWDDITASYGYKSREVAWKKFDLVAASWSFDLTKNIELLSTKSSRGGAHSAWPTNRNEGRVFSVPINAPDKDIGETVLKAFAKCEGPGKSTEPLFP